MQCNKSRKTEIRIGSRELESDLDEFPVLYRQVEQERAKITAKRNRLRTLQKHLVRYNELKELLQDPREFGITPVEHLLDHAKALDCMDDAEAFLAGLRGAA